MSPASPASVSRPGKARDPSAPQRTVPRLEGVRPRPEDNCPPAPRRDGGRHAVRGLIPGPSLGSPHRPRPAPLEPRRAPPPRASCARALPGRNRPREGRGRRGPAGDPARGEERGGGTQGCEAPRWLDDSGETPGRLAKAQIPSVQSQLRDFSRRPNFTFYRRRTATLRAAGDVHHRARPRRWSPGPLRPDAHP